MGASCRNVALRCSAVPYNALVHGRWGTLLLVATLPFVRRALEAFSAPNYSSTGTLAQSASLGLVAVVAAFEPMVFITALAVFWS